MIMIITIIIIAIAIVNYSSYQKEHNAIAKENAIYEEIEGN